MLLLASSSRNRRDLRTACEAVGRVVFTSFIAVGHIRFITYGRQPTCLREYFDPACLEHPERNDRCATGAAPGANRDGKISARDLFMSLGSELRAARERAGLTPAEISERTKIQLYKVEALENDHFESLPDGIYLRGIVRAYAKEVGIDAEPVIARLDQELAKRDVTNVPTPAAPAPPAVPAMPEIVNIAVGAVILTKLLAPIAASHGAASGLFTL